MDFVINDFEGPLDLLLHLIKESKMDIMNIEIEEITKQYMDFLDKQEKMNLEISSEYSFDKTDTTIRPEKNEYVFANNNDVYGLLDYNQKCRYERIKIVKDALSMHQVDVLYLDSCVTDMYNKQVNNGYNK